ncbi:MAG TPA: twin-arginine translocation signal domain-containing protein [Desulfonatronum sp.]|mgnify:CR=1 FL=1|nr:twin-arginine translocation signal domain-containing protein [Desulfonatronum sp.]
MLQRSAGEVTRRNFLRGAGASVAGLAAVGSVGLLLRNTAIAKQEASVKPEAMTWPYVKLDKDKVAARTFEYYFKGG